MTTKKTIEKKVDQLIDIRNVLIELSKKNKFSEENCPLAEDHYDLSETIFGTGQWQWTCGFCGKEESE